MKALVYDGARDACATATCPTPARRRRGRLIRIDSVGICGSDMHAYLGHDDRRPAPLILGHEAAGRHRRPAGRQPRHDQSAGDLRHLPRLSRRARQPLPRPADHLDAAARGRRSPSMIAMPERNLVQVPDAHDPRQGSPGRADRLRLACGAARAGPGPSPAGIARTRAGDRRRGDRPGRGAGLRAQGIEDVTARGAERRPAAAISSFDATRRRGRAR